MVSIQVQCGAGNSTALGNGDKTVECGKEHHGMFKDNRNKTLVAEKTALMGIVLPPFLNLEMKAVLAREVRRKSR